ncbi:MAG: GNAT family N-acetyltransferase [Holophaga sp.]|nr:GNAT family N-acetyltransferase [Holophaga sp.]
MRPTCTPRVVWAGRSRAQEEGQRENECCQLLDHEGSLSTTGSVHLPYLRFNWLAARQSSLAPEGAMAVLNYAFGPLGLAEVVSFTTARNLPSIRVMEKIGMTRDPLDDFDHPKVPEGHPLRRHVLYRCRKQDIG